MSQLQSNYTRSLFRKTKRENVCFLQKVNKFIMLVGRLGDCIKIKSVYYNIRKYIRQAILKDAFQFQIQTPARNTDPRIGPLNSGKANGVLKLKWLWFYLNYAASVGMERYNLKMEVNMAYLHYCNIKIQKKTGVSTS